MAFYGRFHVRNKYYKYGVNTLLVINILLWLFNKALGLTIYWDWCESVLWVIWVFMIMMAPYKKKWYSVPGKVAGSIGIITALGVIYIKNVDTEYGIIASPKRTHQVILKETSEIGLHHRYYTINLYKRVGMIFKKDSYQKIYEYDCPLFIKDGITTYDIKSYKADYDLYMTWLSEDVLRVYIDKNKQRDDELLDVTVNLGE